MHTSTRKGNPGLIAILIILALAIGGLWRAGIIRKSGQPVLGAQKLPLIQTLTPDLARQLGIGTNLTGVVVTAVDPLSGAAAAGIQRRDIIEEVDRKPVHNIEEYQRAIAGLGNKPVLLLLNRSGQTHYAVVESQ